MELRRDLLKISEKSLFRIILGLGSVLIACSWIVVDAFENQIFRIVALPYFIFFVFSGIIHIYEGFGYSVSKLFGKAYILIDTDVIRIKTGVLDKEQFVFWNEVASIYYKAAVFEIRRSDNTTVVLKLSTLEYSLIQQIKEVIGRISVEKGIAADF